MNPETLKIGFSVLFDRVRISFGEIWMIKDIDQKTNMISIENHISKEIRQVNKKHVHLWNQVYLENVEHPSGKWILASHNNINVRWIAK